MNDSTTGQHDNAPDMDVLIVGAGISGIGMAAHLTKDCPDRSYAIVEMRDDIGGTWDLFRYPGVRSDSDMHTLGFVFEPWKHEKTIADGPSILDYLHTIVKERGIDRHIRFGHRIVAANWNGARGYWEITAQLNDGEKKRITARWLYLGSGYYDYDEAYDPGFELGDFTGRVLHPQFWPRDYDYTGDKIVVIGSGATAVTIVPSMADKAAHVTMLQRTPTWMFSRPAKDWFANTLRKILPEETAYRITRWKNVFMQDISFKQARKKPDKVAEDADEAYSARPWATTIIDAATFTPPYDPWDQRVCLVPDDDLFQAMKAGKADIVTDHIERFETGGVRLKSGKFLEADTVVTATGLKLAIAGKIAVTDRWRTGRFRAAISTTRGACFQNCRTLRWCSATSTPAGPCARTSIPITSAGCSTISARRAHRWRRRSWPTITIWWKTIFSISPSGYIQRSKHIMPKNAVAYPWRLNQEYVQDRKIMERDPVDDGVLAFTKVDGVREARKHASRRGCVASMTAGAHLYRRPDRHRR